MSDDLRLSKSLSLPIDAVTQKFAILGRTGSGKSYCATKLCELMLDKHAQVIALDPVGVWYGLRVGGHYSIPIFGGLHGDVPLESNAGEFIANLIVDRGLSAVLDVSQFLGGEQAKFAYDFATRFFFRKKSSPGAVHLFVEECQEFVPQNISGGARGGFETRMLNAFERLIKLGRNFGIGATLISQRPQEVNKKALNQAECMLAFQMTGPQERKAVSLWVADKAGSQDVIDTLPKLKVGQCQVWSPQWLHVSDTIEIAAKKSADVSSTPSAGDHSKRVELKDLSEDELSALAKDMAETVERAKAEDPRELRREIALLKKRESELIKANADLGLMAVEITSKEVPVLKDGQLARLESATTALGKLLTVQIERLDAANETFSKNVREILDRFGETLIPLREALSKLQPKSAISTLVLRKPPIVAAREEAAPLKRGESVPAANGDGSGVSAPQQRILDALASLESLGLRDLDKSNVAVFADASPRSSAYQNNVSRLRTLGLVDYPQQGRVSLTDQGRQQAQSNGTVLTLEGLHNAWFAKLPAPKVRILKEVIGLYPNPIGKAPLADLSGMSPLSSAYQNNVSNLRSLGLIDYPQQGYVVATELLFPPSLS